MRSILLLLLIISTNPAFSSSVTLVEISEAWINEAPPNAKVLAAYMTIENLSTESISLVAIESSDFERIEIHKSIIQDGMASMKQFDSLKLSAMETIKLSPGGYHLMLINPRIALKESMSSEMTLSFSNNETRSISLPVIRRSSAQHHH